MNRRLAIGLAAAAAVGETLVWHGPLGAGGRLAGKIEMSVRAELQRLEMAQVQARLQREPLTRRLILSGPADDFQRSELVRILGRKPGVAGVRWVRLNDPGPRTVPVAAEAALASLAGFLLGLLLAYGIELRRRANAEWRW